VCSVRTLLLAPLLQRLHLVHLLKGAQALQAGQGSDKQVRQAMRTSGLAQAACSCC
jgi:hypothetical protein